MRFTYNFVALAIIASIVAWAARAPKDPAGKAAYLCAPVYTAERVGLAFFAAVHDDGAVEPAIDPWRFNPGERCERIVLRVALAEDP